MPLEQIVNHPFLDPFLPTRPLSNSHREEIPPSSRSKQSLMTDFLTCKSSDPRDSYFKESDLTTADTFLSHTAQTKLTVKSGSFQSRSHSISSSPMDFPPRAPLPKVAKFRNLSSSSVSSFKIPVSSSNVTVFREGG